MVRYRAAYRVDTALFEPLDGKYEFEIQGFEHKLIPCEITAENSRLGTSNFVLDFEFDHDQIPKDERYHLKLFHHSQTPAVEFIAWLSCLSRQWLMLSHQKMGFSGGGAGPTYTESLDSFDESNMESIFNVKKKSRKGQLKKVERPNLSFIAPRDIENYKLPNDFLDLTNKLFSLDDEMRNKFLNACLCYQHALDNLFFAPTLSLVLLVSCVESMVWNEVTSQYCKDARRKCAIKKDVMKKFRLFFETQLQFPLPPDKKEFLDSIYGDRSNYVHRYLMGDEKLRLLMPSIPTDKLELKNSLYQLESLVNASLIRWLERL